MKIEKNFDYTVLGYGADCLEELFLMVKEAEPEIEFHVTKCQKTNRSVDSIVFKLPDVTAAPTIRVSVLREVVEMQGIAAASDWIVRLIREECPLQEGFIGEVMNRDYILKNITIRLVNAERNSHYADFVCREWFDFLLLLTVKLSMPDGIGTFCLTKEQAGALELSEEELFDAALKNSSQNLTIMGMRQLLCSYMGDDADEGLIGMADEADVMYVVTNEEKHFGACMMLHLGKVEEKLGLNEFYVLPSSVHEIIVCSVCAEGGPEFLREMVGEVNADCVAEEDFLSGNVYYYCNGELTIA